MKGKPRKGLLMPAKGLPFKPSNRARGSRTQANRPRRPKRLLCRATPLGISQDIGSLSAAQVPIFFRRPQSSNLLDIPIRTAYICQTCFLAYSTIFHHVLNSLSLISMEIYINTTVTTFLQQRMNNSFINGKMSSS
jgi:hypothetical protein